MRELLAQRTSWKFKFFWARILSHIFHHLNHVTKHQTQLFFSFFVIKIDYRFFSALRCTDFCQRFQKNVMRYAATLRDWNVTLYINFGDVNLTMFFGWLSLQDVADPLFAHCRLHAVKRTSDSKVRKNTKYLTIFAKLPVWCSWECYNEVMDEEISRMTETFLLMNTFTR